MSLERLKKITEDILGEAVIPMDIAKNRTGLGMTTLLYNIASHRSPEEGFKTINDIRMQLHSAIANQYITKDMKGKYYLTKRGESKLRELYSRK